MFETSRRQEEINQCINLKTAIFLVNII